MRSIVQKFFLIFASIFSLNFILNYVFKSKIVYLWGDDEQAILESHFFENKEVFDTAFLGTSRIDQHVDPDFIYKKYGFNSINFGTPGFYFPHTGDVAQMLVNIPKNNLKRIFLELSCPQTLAFENSTSIKERYWRTISSSIFFIRYLVDRRGSFNWKKNLGNFMTLFYAHIQNAFGIGFYRRFADLVFSDKYLTGRSMDQRLNVTNRLGYKLHPEHKQKTEYIAKEVKKRLEEAKKSFRNIDSNVHVNSTLKSYVSSLNEYFKKKNVDLIYVLTPRQVSCYTEIINIFRDLPRSNKIDLANPFEHPEFYSLKYTRDGGHLNRQGTLLFSEKLIQEFLKNR